MGGIGDKAPPGILRGLEAVSQAVELLAQLGDLVVAADLRAVAVSALPHLADGHQQLPQLPRQGLGEPEAQKQHRDPHHGGEPQEVALEPLQQRRLLRVVLVGVHRADDLVLIEYRGGCPAAESTVPVAAAEGVVAQKGLNDLRIDGKLPHGGAGLPGVVENPSGTVRHQDTGKPRLLHHRQSLRHVLLRQPVQSRQGVHHHRDAGLEGGLLGAEHQVLGHQQRIGVEQHQHRRDDENVAQAELYPEAVQKSPLIP